MTHSPPQRSSPLQGEDHFGEKIASYLSAAAAELPNDISERLRAARAQALAQRKSANKSPPASSPAPEGGTRAQAGESTGCLCCDEAVSAC